MNEKLNRLGICLLLSATLAVTVSGAGDNCDLVQVSVNNSQFDPAGAFVGTHQMTILEVDPATGVITPTGETLAIDCQVTLLGFFPGFEYKTSHACEGPPASKVHFTATHTGQFIPLEDDPDGFDFGVIDSGEIVSGKGRWTCGSDAVGINAATGEFNAKARLWSPEAPGNFVGTGVAKWCDCSGENKQ